MGKRHGPRSDRSCARQAACYSCRARRRRPRHGCRARRCRSLVALIVGARRARNPDESCCRTSRKRVCACGAAGAAANCRSEISSTCRPAAGTEYRIHHDEARVGADHDRRTQGDGKGIPGRAAHPARRRSDNLDPGWRCWRDSFDRRRQGSRAARSRRSDLFPSVYSRREISAPITSTTSASRGRARSH